MGLLTTIGDIGKGILNAIPGVGDVTEQVFGQVGQRGIAGRLISTGGGGRNLPGLPSPGSFGLPEVREIPADFGGLNGQAAPGSGGAGATGMMASNGQCAAPPRPMGSNLQQALLQELLTKHGVRGNGSVNMSGRVIMNPGTEVRAKAPPGMVIHTMKNGRKIAIDKNVARSLGLWKPRKKPPISAGDWNKLKTASRVKKKAKKIAEKADFKCRTKAQEARRRAKKR